jgi:uncharacterized protein
MIIERRFGEIKMPRRVFLACGADIANGYAIDPSGNVYKCMRTMEDPNSKLGVISPDGDLSIDYKELSKWYSQDVFEDAECRQCKYLPLCMGGCALAKMEEGRRVCYFKRTGLGIENRIKRFYAAQMAAARERSEGADK